MHITLKLNARSSGDSVSFHLRVLFGTSHLGATSRQRELPITPLDDNLLSEATAAQLVDELHGSVGRREKKREEREGEVGGS
jgi:hypothetical protein